MNPYLSRDEKENLVRLMTLRVQLEKVIELYSSLKNVDKKFLSELRHARTRLEKSADIRLEYLDEQAKENLLLSIARLRIVFMATPEAIQANKEMLELRSTLPIAAEDFQDWYAFLIESTCKTCTRQDYEQCAARRVLSKYDVYPIDPGAKGKCQYSYVGTPEAEELQPVEDTKTVPAMVYNAALAMVKAKEDSINDNYVPLIKQLQAEINTTKAQLVDILYPSEARPVNPILDELIACVNDQMEEIRSLRAQVETATVYGRQATKTITELEIERDKALQQISELQSQLQAAAAAQEQDQEEYPVSIGLASGGEFDYVLPARMTQAMIKEIQQPRHSRGTCAQYLNGQLVAIDLQEVVALHVDQLPQGEWVKQKAAQGAPGQQEKYRIECKCGAEYFADMNAGRTKAWCRDCKAAVFADRKASDESTATLLTNRYWVSREPQVSEEKILINDSMKSDLRDIKNIGKEYVDPCRLLG